MRAVEKASVRLSPYLYTARIGILDALTYRFDVFSAIAISCIIMIATAFFWQAAYGVRDTALGVTIDGMLTYAVISAVLSALMTYGVEDRIQDSIGNGVVALDRMKPVSVFAMYLAEDLGKVATALMQRALPLLIVACVFITVPLPASAGAFFLFLLSACFSYAINWLLAAIFGMWSYWTVRMWSLSHAKASIIRLLSGSLIPLWFFPGWAQSILKFLPFQYIYQLPLSIYIGKLTPRETAFELGIQVLWTFLLYLFFRRVESRLDARVIVQGG